MGEGVLAGEKAQKAAVRMKRTLPTRSHARGFLLDGGMARMFCKR